MTLSNVSSPVCCQHTRWMVRVRQEGDGRDVGLLWGLSPSRLFMALIILYVIPLQVIAFIILFASYFTLKLDSMICFIIVH